MVIKLVVVVVFDVNSSYFAGNHYTAGSSKRSSYVAERTCKRQNKFTNSFYRFKFNLFVLGAGRRHTQRETKYFKEEPIQRRFDFSGVLYFGWPNQPSSEFLKLSLYLKKAGFRN